MNNYYLQNNNKLNNLLNNFIDKVVNDNKNYNVIKNLNNNLKRKIKVNNIFIENNEIQNISSRKIILNKSLNSKLNEYLIESKILDNYYLRKIVIFYFEINESNIKKFISFDYKNYNEFYKLQFIDFNIINKNLYIKNKLLENIDNLYFLDDLQSIYLLFEKKDSNNFYINKKYKLTNKTKKNLIKQKKSNKTKKI
tara:strand:- start:47 stop:634 length:588 start_codon:yes stop_codon:yes gene_type:complete